MQGISEFFGKIRGAHIREIQVRSVLQKVIHEQIGLEIPLEAFSFNNGVAVINGIDAAARSALFIKKASILKQVNSMQDIRNIVDIR